MKVLMAGGAAAASPAGRQSHQIQTVPLCTVTIMYSMEYFGVLVINFYRGIKKASIIKIFSKHLLIHTNSVVIMIRYNHKFANSSSNIHQ